MVWSGIAIGYIFFRNSIAPRMFTYYAFPKRFISILTHLSYYFPTALSIQFMVIASIIVADDYLLILLYLLWLMSVGSHHSKKWRIFKS